MRRALTLLGLCGVAAGCWHGGVVGPLPAAAAAQTPVAARTYPANLLVYAQEWSLYPSRTTVPAGTIDVELWNRGQDAHDVEVRRLNAAGTMVGPVLGSVTATPSGAIHHGVWHLRAGRYELFCSMPGHMGMGMHSRITVTARR